MTKHEESGMTDYQYKCMLIDQQFKWKELLDLAQSGDMESVIRYIQKEIELTERKMNF